MATCTHCGQEIKSRRPTRSLEQNAALWGVAYKAIRDATGNDPDDLHLYFCGEYFGWVEQEMFGAVRRKPRRTTTRDEYGNRAVMSTMDFANFYSFIQQRAAENGYDVPDPNEHEFAKAS